MDVPSTHEHRRPESPDRGRRRPALICAFPRPIALAVPDSGTRVGRKWLAEAGIVDTEVSTEHLRVDRAGGALRVADVGSRNGTWVDGHRLSTNELVSLEDGAVLRIGNTIFVFRERLLGPREPADPVAETMVGPFGLREVARALEGFVRHPPPSVLVEGATGTGKELAARAIARGLGRATPLAAINVASLARGVFESQLFGHVAGAFSDAKVASPGLLVAHHGGTVFLDEIGELDLELQAKLLRVLENREVLPVGGHRPVGVDVFFVAATNRDLDEMVAAGTFRRDLLTRLTHGRVELPTLRDRVEDLFAVAVALTARHGSALEPQGAEVEAVERLMLQPWTGNVRELDATLAAATRLDPRPGLRAWAIDEVLGPRPANATRVLDREAAAEAIARAGGNVSAAAAALGVSRGKLLRLRKQS